ncbi:beta-hexosaminidase [[Candida] anglica]|uniref:Beta-hexosaminidase n=1 Tax=[Candida] anglica TaxID=148631 RepID=A0ABP0EHN6_9ASCO
MKVSLLLSQFCFAGLISAAFVDPLPAPRNVTWGNSGSITFADKPDLHVDGASNDVLLQAFERMWTTVTDLKWIPYSVAANITHGSVSQKKLSNITVSLSDEKSDLQLGVSETYTLDVTEDAVVIEADTVWGALHAFTTLQQLFIYNKESQNYYIENPVSIWDEPLYQHRGIMLDTGRNFLSKGKIMQQIEVMALCKLNVLHWHMVDTQSWAIEIKTYPEMIKDAYSDRESFSQEDILDIIQYGKTHGVRIVPEVDLPGHANSGWKRVDPSIVACGNTFWADTAVEPGPGQLDISSNKTIQVVKNVYKELSKLFPDNVFHIGADELQATCWNTSSGILDWYKSHPASPSKGSGFIQLLQYWVDMMYPFFTKSKRITTWQDFITDGVNVPKDTIIQTWNGGASSTKNLTSSGYDVIVSTADFLYLDCGYGGFVTNDPRYLDLAKNDEFNEGAGGSWCNPYKTWQRIYNYDFADGLTEEENKRVLGAEVALWSEQVDSTVVTQKLWPRAAALAESTWSGNKDDKGDYRAYYFTQRINEFREYLVEMGVDASPLVPKMCVKYPHTCDFYKDPLELNKWNTTTAA